MLKVSGVNDVGVSFTLEMSGSDTSRFGIALESVQHVKPRVEKRPTSPIRRVVRWTEARRKRFFQQKTPAKTKKNIPKDSRSIGKLKRFVIGGYIPEEKLVAVMEQRNYAPDAIAWELYDTRLTRAQLQDLWLYGATA